MGRRDLKHYIGFDFLQSVDYIHFAKLINDPIMTKEFMELWAGEHLNYGQEFKDLN